MPSAYLEKNPLIYQTFLVRLAGGPLQVQFFKVWCVTMLYWMERATSATIYLSTAWVYA